MGKNSISDPEDYGDADEPDFDNYRQTASSETSESSQSEQTDSLPRSTTWIVPPGASEVTVTVKDRTGRVLNSYTISNYITLTPGMKLEVSAD